MPGNNASAAYACAGVSFIVVSVRRLLQIGLGLLLTISVLAPIEEYFDHWDLPGLGNDTELAVFLVVLFICLVLVVALALALRAHSRQTVHRLVPLRVRENHVYARFALRLAVYPDTSPPLRI